MKNALRLNENSQRPVVLTKTNTCQVAKVDGTICHNASLSRHGYCWNHLKNLLPEEAEKFIHETIFNSKRSEGLTKINLQGVDFRGVDLNNAKFFECDLTGALFDGCVAENILFEKCILENSSFIESNIKKGKFLKCFMNRADFTEADMENTRLDDSNMSNTVMTKANWATAVVVNCTLNHTILYNAILVKTEFKKSVFLYAVLDNAVCNGAKFTNANLSNASLSRAILDGVSFQHANLKNTRLQGANCSDADFQNAILTGSQMNYANLSNAKFSKWALSDVQMSGADVTGVELNESGLTLGDIVEENGKVSVVRQLPTKRESIGVFSWILDYPIYCVAERLYSTGVTRGFEYLLGVLVGGGLAFMLNLINREFTVVGFWTGFVAVLVLYKNVLPRKIIERREYLSNLDAILFRKQENV